MSRSRVGPRIGNTSSGPACRRRRRSASVAGQVVVGVDIAEQEPLALERALQLAVPAGRAQCCGCRRCRRPTDDDARPLAPSECRTVSAPRRRPARTRRARLPARSDTPSSASRSVRIRSVSVCAVVIENGYGLSTASKADPAQHLSGRVQLHRRSVSDAGRDRAARPLPIRSIISRLRAWTQDRPGLDGRRGQLVDHPDRTPRRASSQASTRPTGPAPTTSTDVEPELTASAGKTACRPRSCWRRWWLRS